MDPKAKPFTSTSAKGSTSNSGAHPSEVEWASINSVLDKNGGPKSSGSGSSGGNSGGSSSQGGKDSENVATGSATEEDFLKGYMI
ncbi:hypothetical protein IFR04_009110 [Cadophora malorum]|uniref:Uncharacterized protein n=1 Tax=Cadophora malorum TaxID=108018 RepID=A0A8H7TF62_9HELO|nr:hypothetical protein IFR04_009110 [Cadophora malorum]